jgi:hypothetical protein
MKDSMMELQDLVRQMSQALVRVTEIVQMHATPQLPLEPKTEPSTYGAAGQMSAAQQAVFDTVEADSKVGKRTSLAFLAARLVQRDKRNVTLADQLKVRQLLVQRYGKDAWVGDQQCCIRSVRDAALRGDQ